MKVNFLSQSKHSLHTKETPTPFNLLYSNNLKWKRVNLHSQSQNLPVLFTFAINDATNHSAIETFQQNFQNQIFTSNQSKSC